MDHLLIIAGLCGGMAGYGGAALSASAEALPTGPLIVLLAFGLFALSLLSAPQRGALALWLKYRRFQHLVHMRQGLLALGQGQPIRDGFTLRVLARVGLIRPDGVPTDTGRGDGGGVCRDVRDGRAADRTEQHVACAS